MTWRWRRIDKFLEMTPEVGLTDPMKIVEMESAGHEKE